MEMETVPKEEIKTRMEKFQSILKRDGLDGAFIQQNSDLFYFTGTIQAPVLFVPVEGRPILMVRKALQRAVEESPWTDILPWKDRSSLPRILREQGIRDLRHAGLELDVLPASLYFWFQKSFPQCRWSDVSDSIRRLRMIKSEYEVEQIRKALSILHTGFQEIRKIIRPGMTELEVDGHLALIARREGHMGFLRMRGWNQEMTYAHVLSGENGARIASLNSPHGGQGNTPAFAQGAGFRRIRKDEPIGIDYGVAVEGYLSDQFRTFVVGHLPLDLEQAHECSREILEILKSEVRPGTAWSQIYDMALQRAKKAGLEPYFMGHGEGKVRFIGHGIGLEIDEYPILSPGFDEPIEEGMVFALEPKFIFPGKGLVGLEDDYLVTRTGLERLSITDQKIMRVE